MTNTVLLATRKFSKPKHSSLVHSRQPWHCYWKEERVGPVGGYDGPPFLNHAVTCGYRLMITDNFYTRHALAKAVKTFTDSETRTIGTVRKRNVEKLSEKPVDDPMTWESLAPRGTSNSSLSQSVKLGMRSAKRSTLTSSALFLKCIENRFHHHQWCLSPTQVTSCSSIRKWSYSTQMIFAPRQTSSAWTKMFLW